MAITHVGTDTSTTFTGTVTLTLKQTPAAGNCLVLTMATNNGGAPGARGCNAVIQAGFSGFTQYVSSSGNHSEAEVWAGFNASGSGGLLLFVSATRGTDLVVVNVAEFSGVSSTQDDGVTTAVGTCVAAQQQPFTTTLTTTNANDLIIGSVTTNVNGLAAYNGSWTSFQNQPLNDQTSAQIWSVFNITNATGNYGTNWSYTSGNSTTFTTAVVAFVSNVVVPPVIMPLIGQHLNPLSEPLEGTLLTRL